MVKRTSDAFYFKIGKKRWLVCFVKLHKAFSWCFQGYGVILLDERLRGKQLLDAAIHETLHALDWSKSEKQVRKATKAIMEILNEV